MEAGWAFSTRKPFTVQGCPANIRILRPGSLCASPPSTVTTTDSPRPCFQVRRINWRCCRVSYGHWRGNCWTLTRFDWSERITSIEEVRRTPSTIYLSRPHAAVEDIKQLTATLFLLFSTSFTHTHTEKQWKIRWRLWPPALGSNLSFYIYQLCGQGENCLTSCASASSSIKQSTHLSELCGSPSQQKAQNTLFIITSGKNPLVRKEWNITTTYRFSNQ